MKGVLDFEPVITVGIKVATINQTVDIGVDTVVEIVVKGGCRVVGL